MKRFFFFSSFLFTTILGILPNQGWASGEPYRSCSNEDVIGAWTMPHQMINSKIDTSDPFYFRYQRYVFEEDKTMKHLTSNQPITDKERELQSKAPANRTYDVSNDGTLIIKKKNSSDVEMMVCTYITGDQPNAPVTAAHKGDIVLTFIVKPNEPPVLMRLLRREKD